MICQTVNIHATIIQVKKYIYNIIITPKLFLFPHITFQFLLSLSSSKYNRYADWQHYSQVLPAFELHINRIIQSILFCIWLLFINIVFDAEPFCHL